MGEARGELPSSSGKSTASDSSWWLSRAWRGWITNFESAWFLVYMGTGVKGVIFPLQSTTTDRLSADSVSQVLATYPYPTAWLHTIGYIFGILDILLFAALSVTGLLHLAMHRPTLRPAFAQTAALGTIPIALDTIAIGLTTFHPADPRPASSRSVLGLCLMRLPAYVHRLLAHGAPPHAASPDAFVPPRCTFATGRGAPRLTPTGDPAPFAAASQSVGAHALGIRAARALRGLGLFFIVRGFCVAGARWPRRFVAGCWACVFPVGSWANAMGRVGVDVGSEGLKGLGVGTGGVTVVSWGICAAANVWWIARGRETEGHELYDAEEQAG